MNYNKPPESPSQAKRRQASEALIQLLKSKLGSLIVSSEVTLGDAVLRIERASIPQFFKLLKLDSELAFDFLVSVTATDWLDQKENRFEMVYHIASLTKGYRVRVKAYVPEANPEVDSITPLFSAANFMEREVWDMYGIRFKGHPDLRRILMYDEFVGHPLRKDYPVQGKQPRVPMRHAETRNTAVDMKRSALVQITRRQNTGAAGGLK